MSRRKVGRLRRELEALRAGKYSLKTSELVNFAGRVGRTRDLTRGKEPTYKNFRFPSLNPLSIPGHPTINPFTANSILDVLESDLDRWDDWLEEEEKKKAREKKELAKEGESSDEPNGKDKKL